MKKLIFVITLLVSNIALASSSFRAGDRVYDRYFQRAGVVQEVFTGGVILLKYDATHAKPSEEQVASAKTLVRSVKCHQSICIGHRVFNGVWSIPGIVEEVFPNGMLMVKYDPNPHLFPRSMTDIRELLFRTN